MLVLWWTGHGGGYGGYGGDCRLAVEPAWLSGVRPVSPCLASSSGLRTSRSCYLATYLDSILTWRHTYPLPSPSPTLAVFLCYMQTGPQNMSNV